MECSEWGVNCAEGPASACPLRVHAVDIRVAHHICVQAYPPLGVVIVACPPVGPRLHLQQVGIRVLVRGRAEVLLVGASPCLQYHSIVVVRGNNTLVQVHIRPRRLREVGERHSAGGGEVVLVGKRGGNHLVLDKHCDVGVYGAHSRVVDLRQVDAHYSSDVKQVLGSQGQAGHVLAVHCLGIEDIELDYMSITPATDHVGELVETVQDKDRLTAGVGQDTFGVAHTVVVVRRAIRGDAVAG